MDAACPLCHKVPSAGDGSAGLVECPACHVRFRPGADGDGTPRAGRRRLPSLADLLVHNGYRDGGKLLSVGAGPRPFGPKGEPWTVEVADRPLAALPGDERYDVIVLDHHLGDVPDPRAALRDARRLLRSRGCVVVLEGDSASLAARALGRLWGPVRRGCPVVFSRTGLEDLLRQEGFVVLDVALGTASPIAPVLPGPVVRLPLPAVAGEVTLITRRSR